MEKFVEPWSTVGKFRCWFFALTKSDIQCQRSNKCKMLFWLRVTTWPMEWAGFVSTCPKHWNRIGANTFWGLLWAGEFVNTIMLRQNYLSRESFVAKFVSSFFPSNPVGPASQLALQVCLHVVSIRCSFNHFQIFQTLDSDNNGFLSFKEFVLGLNVTANGTRYKTLPKAQRTRGLSSSYQSNFLRSYHKFKHKFWSHFIFTISTKHQLKFSTKHQHLH